MRVDLKDLTKVMRICTIAKAEVGQEAELQCVERHVNHLSWNRGNMGHCVLVLRIVIREIHRLQHCGVSIQEDIFWVDRKYIYQVLGDFLLLSMKLDSEFAFPALFHSFCLFIFSTFIIDQKYHLACS